MPNIIDSIQISSSTFDVRDKSATTVVNLTQEQYDNLPSSAKTANVLYNITDATAGDLSQYWTSAQTQSAITEATSGKADTSYVDQSVSGKVDTTTFNTYSGNVETALSGKQDTLSAGTGIDITDNVISATGGGGKAIEAGRGISVTTGETADTVSFNLPISADTFYYSIIEGDRNNKATKTYAHAEGGNTTASGSRSHAEGYYTVASGDYSHTEGQNCYARKISSHAEGTNTDAKENYSHTEGLYTIANNQSEHASGQYNVSSKANTTFGDSGNTLFSVGNGTADNARHNAFEIRQNGDIYLTKDGQDVKLQDQLGGGGGKAIEAGRGISITTGETADTVSFNLPISAGTGTNSIKCGETYEASGGDSFAIGSTGVKAKGLCSFAGGSYSEAKGIFSMAFGRYNTTNNYGEVALGFFNISNGSSSAAGNSSGNTLFSVGNGTNNTSSTRHNAFEIRQNGDIYLSSGGTDIKLQDYLGGGGSSINVVQTTGSSTTDVMSQAAVTTKLNTKLDSVRVEPKAPTSNYTQLNLYLERGNSGVQSLFTYVKTINGKSITSQNNDNLEGFSLIETSAITTSLSSSSTDAQVPSAKAVNDKLGGLSLVKLTQAEYDALATKDSNTLYVING